jgi:hypothetical protein
MIFQYKTKENRKFYAPQGLNAFGGAYFFAKRYILRAVSRSFAEQIQAKEIFSLF